MTNAVLTLNRLEVRRGSRLVLEIPHLALATGEVLAIMGPNGAGKSTLLEVAALLRRPDAGEVWIGGERVTRRTDSALRRRLAMVFQVPLLFDVKVLENVTAGMRFRGTGRREAEQRALGWLERFGVAHLAARPARGLSGGEAQRVSLARAFAVEPEVLLLDEPFMALDAPTRVAIVPDLARELRSANMAAIIATHDRADVAVLADRLAILIEGRIVQDGTPADVAAAPSSRSVAALINPEYAMRQVSE